MTDEEFLVGLERCELPESEFGHAAHVRAGYLYLRREGFAQALERAGRAIRNYAAHLGKADRYHETITVAYLALIQQHMFEHGAGENWADFARHSPALLDRQLLQRFYSESELNTDLARRIFVLPRPLGAEGNECG